jgi:hypothetical protein
MKPKSATTENIARDRKKRRAGGAVNRLIHLPELPKVINDIFLAFISSQPIQQIKCFSDTIQTVTGKASTPSKQNYHGIDWVSIPWQRLLSFNHPYLLKNQFV